MAYTGGELNLLNGKYGISAPFRSVPVMKLIRVHQPKSKEELYRLIKYHHEAPCGCGVESKGSIEDFGRNLYESQIKEWGAYRYSLQACIQWEYDLFVVQSLKGSLLEKKGLAVLQNQLPNHRIIEAEGFVDEELRIDLIVLKDGKECCGVQVKPHSFNAMRESVILYNKHSNQKWGKPVSYLFYDEQEVFTNLNEVITQINDVQ